MGKRKASRPSWFKLFLNLKPLIDAVPDDAAGKGLKAALRYFDTEELSELDPMARAVFDALKHSVDESFDDFRKSVETGRAGGRKRWGNEDRPPIGPLSHPIGVSTEERRENIEDRRQMIDGRGEGEEAWADKPPNAAFTKPSVTEVERYCQSEGISIDVEKFVCYYQANGWRVGNTPMNDWKSAVRYWAKTERRNTRKTIPYGASGELGEAELEAIRRVLHDDGICNTV